MSLQKPVNVQCPYCGESIELMVDCSVDSQKYTEDCQICCNPMTVLIKVDADDFPVVEVRRENE